ncbi:MAG: hypothetical protein VKL39_07495 [Leptolyngbyaceae bacterium]|nr:hypothetical protein [Leptolyngbyaceae bacterium]
MKSSEDAASQNQPEITEADPLPSTDSPTDTSPDDAGSGSIVDERRLISENGLGLAQLGMTFAELKQALPPDTEYVVESPFMVDFDAVTVRQNGEELFHILYFAGDTFSDDSIVQGVMTKNEEYQTAEGIGVSSPIQAAEEAYGNATLSYSWANEGREYVRFENPPAVNLSFRVWRGDTPSTDFVGVYPSTTPEFNETEEYIEGAAIKAILVSCIAEACAL